MQRPLRLLLADWVLFALVVRALIPQGFMPTADRPFAVELCSEGLPAHVQLALGRQAPGPAHSHSDHCVFGTACPGGPLSQPPATLAPWFAMVAPLPPVATLAGIVRLVHLPHPRGPPSSR